MGSDLHDRLFDAISSQIATLRAGAPAARPDGGAWSQAEIDQEIAASESDLAVLKQHWQITPGVAGLASEKHPVTASCGNAQPCPHVLGLAEKYGVPVVA